MKLEQVILTELNKVSNNEDDLSKHFNKETNIIIPTLQHNNYVHDVVFAKKESASCSNISNILNKDISQFDSNKENSSRLNDIEQRINSIRELHKSVPKKSVSNGSVKKVSIINHNIIIDQKLSNINHKINHITQIADANNKTKSTNYNSKLNDSDISCFSWCGGSSGKK